MDQVSSFFSRETRTAKKHLPPPPPPLMGGKHISHFGGIVKWISQKKLWIKKHRPRRKELISRSDYLERGFKKLC